MTQTDLRANTIANAREAAWENGFYYDKKASKMINWKNIRLH